MGGTTMSHQPKAAADIPVSHEDLEMAQDDIQMSQEALHDTLEQMKEALAAGTAIDPKLFQEAEEHAKELEAQAGSLRNDLKRLQKQQSPTS
jgi:chaperonin cofactor prefoldin